MKLRNGAFVKHVVSPRSYGHGIGVGDVNGDGRNDIITPLGWLEAPADPRTGDWKFHQEFDLVSVGYIYVLDVNGDGRKDLVTSMAHDYGVFWMENLGGGKWAKHVIDDTWSQAHALTMVDLNGDGRPDFVTGKRYMAHNGSDPGEREPLGIYWYEYRPAKDGSIEWIKHIIDYGGRAGAGMQIAVADLDGDGDLDLAMGGKTGLFLFENLTRTGREAGSRTSLDAAQIAGRVRCFWRRIAVDCSTRRRTGRDTATIKARSDILRSPRSTPANVSKLIPAWTFSMKREGVPFRPSQSIPLVVNGIMYLGWPFNHVAAMDSETGQDPLGVHCAKRLHGQRRLDAQPGVLARRREIAPGNFFRHRGGRN